MEAGVRKASKEETAGGVCAGGSVGLWGFKARFCATWPYPPSYRLGLFYRS